MEKLLEALSVEKSVHWDNNGKVFIDGSEIEGSNLGNLISALFRQDPVGFEAFRKKLRDLKLL